MDATIDIVRMNMNKSFGFKQIQQLHDWFIIIIIFVSSVSKFQTNLTVQVLEQM